MPEMDGFALAEQIRREADVARATIMMLTSLGHQVDAGRCRELGLSAYLVKPVKQSELLRAVRAALGATEARKVTPPRVPRVQAPPLAGLRVLVAEDNPVNQLLSMRLLEKAGPTVVVVSDGNEALAV